MTAQDEKPRKPLARLLPELSLDRRVTILMIILTLAVLGVIALRAIPLELIPGGFSSPFLRVFVPWHDAPAREVLDKITLPLEEELSTVGGIDQVFSSSGTGAASVFMSFKLGTDMDVAYRELRDRVERARLRMPSDVEQVFIRKDDEAAFPIAAVGVIVADGTNASYDLIQNEIVLPLERLDGVATIQAQGLQEKEILIELDRERLEAAGLNIYRLAQDLQDDNFVLASGNVRAGDRKLLLRSVARYRSQSVMEDLRVAPNVRLSDIAEIKYEVPDEEFVVRVNGSPALGLMVMKEGDANTLEVAERVAEQVEKFQSNPRLRESTEIELFLNQADIIRNSLWTLFGAGRVGAIFAVVVLLFFLRRVRMSLIVAASIPLSMVVALVTMYFAGESLNILSLLGLMISVGLLVDNSVVVAENIHRIHQEGVRRREATLRGTAEIALAITTATLTTAVVFLPMALVDGQGQFFMLRLAIPIAVSLGASLIIALVVVPLSVYLTLPARDASPGPLSESVHRVFQTGLERSYNVSFGRLNQAYQLTLALSLKRRLELVLVIGALFYGTQFWLSDMVEVVPMSQEDQAGFSIDVQMPRNITFEETQAYFLLAERAVAEIIGELGVEYYVISHQRFSGQIQGMMGPGGTSEVKLSPREMSDKVLAVMPELPGIKVHTGSRSDAESDTQLSLEHLTLFGEDAEQLEETADDLEELFARVPGVLGVQSSGEQAPTELGLVLQRDLAQRQGVDPRALAGIVGYALRGQALPRLYVGGRDIPVRVRFEEADRESLAELSSFAVPTESGGTVALSSVVDVKQLPSATRIFRRNKRTARRITLELEEGREQETRQRLRVFTAGIDLPEGMRFDSQPRRGLDEEIANLTFAATLSVVFVYLLMGFLLESFLLPLAILVTIPLASMGVTWAHLLAGKDLDFLGIVGLILLIGVVVNNGIVLLDYVNRLRRDGLERTEAVLLAARRRFRPIMMTALTTICGMVPLTFAEATQIGMSYKSFGLTLIGGMVTASFLTLLVVPVTYTLFEDGREWLLGSLRDAVRRGASRPRASRS